MSDLSTMSLLLPTMITVAVSYFIAWFYRNDYDPKKMLIAYLIYVVPMGALGYFVHLNVVLVIGIYLFGGIVLIFRNSTYFNR